MEPERNVVAIIQARMRSTRLPGKVLADIGGEPMLGRIVARVQHSRQVRKIVVATSDAVLDDPIAEFCEHKGVGLFRGHETDVLDRFYHAAKAHGAQVIVRITGDCPLIDPEVIDRVTGAFFSDGCDYASNTLICTYPDGLETEVFSFAALETAWRDARRAADRAHVTPYLRTSKRFRLRNVESELGRSLRHMRWTVHDGRDLEFVRAVYARLHGKKIFGWRNVLSLLDAEPDLLRLNSDFTRHEDYYHALASEAPMPAHRRILRRSQELKQRIDAVIPGGSQTPGKGAAPYVQGVAPAFLARGHGSHVWDADDNEYIDYPMALGPVILGHGYPAVEEAVKRQLIDGTAFSLPHPLEIAVAEQLVSMVPCAEMVRFGKNGSDATSGAMGLARACAGRDLIACCGWQDWYIGSTTVNRGVPKAVQQLTLAFEYNRIESLQALFAEHPGKIAGVIMEPVGVVEPKDSFLQQVQTLCKREKALLIFDEVITGFRLGRGGAQEHFGVTPDLSCFGNAMANGYPISAVAGPREIMKTFEDVFFSFTFGAETLSLAAALATLQEIAEREVVAHIWEQGLKLLDGINALARQFGMERIVLCQGLPPRAVISFYDESGRDSLLVKSLFQQECLKRGVLFSGEQNLCFSHSNADIEHTLRVYRTALEILRDAMQKDCLREKLEGKPVEPMLRKG